METRTINPTQMNELEAKILGDYLAKNAEIHLDTHTLYNGEFNLQGYNLILDEDSSTDDNKIYRIYSTKDNVLDREGNEIKLTLDEGGNNKLKNLAGSIKIKLNSKTPTAQFTTEDNNNSLVRITNPKAAEQKRVNNAYNNIANVKNAPYVPDETLQKYQSLQLTFKEHLNRRSLFARQKRVEDTGKIHYKHVSLENYFLGKTTFDAVCDFYEELGTIDLDEVITYLLLPALEAYKAQIQAIGHVHRDIKVNNIMIDGVSIDIYDEERQLATNRKGRLQGEAKFYYIDCEDAQPVGSILTDHFGTPGYIPLCILEPDLSKNSKAVTNQESRDLFAIALVLIFYLNPNYDVEAYITNYYITDGDPYVASYNMYKEMDGIFNFDLIKKMAENAGQDSDLFECVNLPVPDATPEGQALRDDIKNLFVDMMQNATKDEQRNTDFYITELKKIKERVDTLFAKERTQPVADTTQNQISLLSLPSTNLMDSSGSTSTSPNSKNSTPKKPPFSPNHAIKAKREKSTIKKRQSTPQRNNNHLQMKEEDNITKKNSAPSSTATTPLVEKKKSVKRTELPTIHSPILTSVIPTSPTRSSRKKLTFLFAQNEEDPDVKTTTLTSASHPSPRNKSSNN